MNWAAISFDWNQIRAFLAVADRGSLSAAARVLSLTQPTVGRQISALEQALGVVLVERTGRSVTLTPTGQDLVEHVRVMADAATKVSLAASGHSQTIEGLVTITASDVMCTYTLPRILQRLSEFAPMLEVHLIADNQIRDLLRREADIAIRHVRPDQADLIARLVQEPTAHLYASEDYLSQRGWPKTKEDLRHHDFIGLSDNERMIAHLRNLDINVTPENFLYGSNSGVAAWELVKQGLGVLVMADDVAQGTDGIERLLPDMEAIQFPVWLTTHRELRTSRRIRVAFDFLAKELAGASSQQLA
ncbi:MAG: LysR family transcriptional regulator [Pseudomonadota bacterium]